MIICNTVKGKGVSFMENKHAWHGKAPKAAEYETAKKELDENLVEIRGEK
jgi:transketolase